MKRFFHDVARVLFLMVVVGFLLIHFDPSNVVILQCTGIALFLVGGTHLTRRVLFHRIDLQSIMLQAVLEKNMPAAIISCAIILFLIALTFIPLLVLK